ncbi:hypothetical protein BX661DRAFT_183763 [Kickxella alabastrina]|uniref:uncharacterized protein n=1 Tax=Kickxella alabastrina TaxID=61397 RepID=UPI00222018CF|nr:uncharacterized protein BX661DRAFT_183763 [Kickxella alabastrina]KAI7826303.1 hypothetical protein BX661DRAFT_183763 [Kickxella alabastrina]
MQLKSVFLQALFVSLAIFSFAKLLLLTGIVNSVKRVWPVLRINMFTNMQAIKTYAGNEAFTKVINLLGGPYLPILPNLVIFNKVIAITGTDYMKLIISYHVVVAADSNKCNPYFSEVGSADINTMTESSAETESLTETESSTKTKTEDTLNIYSETSSDPLRVYTSSV